MKIRIADLSELLSGEVIGDGEIEVFSPAKIEEGAEGTVTFLGNMKYEKYIYTTKASAVIVDKSFKPSQKVLPTLIKVDDVYGAIAILMNKFNDSSHDVSGISNMASIDKTAKIEDLVSIGEFTVVRANVKIGTNTTIYPQVFVGKDVIIGKNVVLYPGVKIYKGTQIGDNCIIHSNAVLGSDGFGFAPNENGEFQKIPQLGNVLVESDVEIGSSTVIDRGSMGNTVIRKGVKLDNLIQIGHNVELGKNTVIAAQTGIAGSTKIGESCMIGGQAGFAGHLVIADGSKFQAQTGMGHSNKEPNQAFFGSPAIPYIDYVRSYGVFKKLPEIYKKVHKLEKAVDFLTESTED